MGFALQKCENDCDTHCNLPLQGLDADNCHAVTAGFYDAKKVVIVMTTWWCACADRPKMMRIRVDTVLVTEDNPPARGRTYLL
jgi:hypothetical protein